MSQNFLNVCGSIGAKYRAIPLEISQVNGIRKDEYFIFLPGESLAALDKNSSAYVAAKDLENGDVIASPLFANQITIDKIDLFVLLPDIKSDIFRFQETLQIFCSERFTSAADELKGISFVAID